VSLLQAGLPDRADELRLYFDTAQPFRRLVIDHFLTPEYWEQLMAGFPAFDDRRALNERGEIGGKAVHQNIAEFGPAYAGVDRMLRSRKFLIFVSRITGIPDLLHDPGYVGGGTHENSHGQDLDPHVDLRSGDP
jgi:hypothetical protein